MADIFWLMQADPETIDDLTEHSRIPFRDLVKSEEQLARLEPGQLVVVRFGEGLDHEWAGQMRFYRIENVTGDDVNVVLLEEVSDRAEELDIWWSRFKPVPLTYRTMLVSPLLVIEDHFGLYETVEAGFPSREGLVERYFIVRADSLEEAEELVKGHSELSADNRYICVAVQNDSIQWRMLEVGESGELTLLHHAPNTINPEVERSFSAMQRAKDSWPTVFAKAWDIVMATEGLEEVPYDELWFYHFLKLPLQPINDNDSRMWQGLMEWVRTDEMFKLRTVLHEAAHAQIRELLSEENISDLTVQEFNDQVWEIGAVKDEAGTKLEDEQIQQLRAEELERRIQQGELTIEGNQTVSAGAQWAAMLNDKSEEEKLKLLHDSLRRLLYGSDNKYQIVEKLGDERNGFGHGGLTFLLNVFHPDQYGIMNSSSKRGLERLAWLLGKEDDWQDVHKSYETFNDHLLTLLDKSGGACEDLVALDALLHELDKMDDPRYRKIAIGIGDEYHEDLAELCKSEGLAAIGFPDEDDNGNVQRLRSIQPGDYVVMHLEGNIGGVGRVIRPYYDTGERVPSGEGVEHFCRRIGVDWLLGETDIGMLNKGEHLRTVTKLDENRFWEIASHYQDDARFAEVLNPPSFSHFVFVVGTDAPEEEERGEAYYFTDKAAGSPQQLRRAIEENNIVRYVLYHTGPQFSFTGFGQVVDADPDDEDERVRLKLAHEKFDKPLRAKAAGSSEWMSKTDFLTDGLGIFSTNSILPISDQDYSVLVEAAQQRQLEELAELCCTNAARLQEIIDLLREKRQMIFYGPPGTGKTYIAREIAKYLSKCREERWGLIQFHPSYTYEDFMEGIKPESVEDAEGSYRVSYPVRPGSFKRFCDRARQDPESKYVFVIDEINRGQISKIFGELMYLLEYRGDEIELAYTKSEQDGAWTSQTFSIPDNVLIIGTMNTADRSIALVDHALRRRFCFYPFFPDDDFCQPTLSNWLEKENLQDRQWIVELLETLNSEIAKEVGRDLLIGHSYFMAEGIDEHKVRQIWRFHIMPLLEEYYASNPTCLEDFRDVQTWISRAKGEREEATGPQLGAETTEGEEVPADATSNPGADASVDDGGGQGSL